MTHNKIHRQHKRSLSFHERQNRFFAVSLITLTGVVFAGILWLVNRPNLGLH